MSTAGTKLLIEDVESTVRQIAAEIAGVKVENVALESSLELDLKFDSLDRVEFAMKLEEAYELEIPDEEAEKVRTVTDAVGLIHAHR